MFAPANPHGISTSSQFLCFSSLFPPTLLGPRRKSTRTPAKRSQGNSLDNGPVSVVIGPDQAQNLATAQSASMSAPGQPPPEIQDAAPHIAPVILDPAPHFAAIVQNSAPPAINQDFVPRTAPFNPVSTPHFAAIVHDAAPYIAPSTGTGQTAPAQPGMLNVPPNQSSQLPLHQYPQFPQQYSAAAPQYPWGQYAAAPPVNQFCMPSPMAQGKA